MTVDWNQTLGVGMRRDVPIGSVFLLLILLSAAGCQPPLPTVPVSGRLVYRQKPVEGAWIAFIDTLPDGKGAVAITDQDGRFDMRTYIGGEKFMPGVFPAEYLVIVGKAPPNADAGPPSYPTSEKMAEFTRNAPRAKTLKERMEIAASYRPMESKPPEEMTLLPVKYFDPRETDLTAKVIRGEANDFVFELVD